MWWSIGGFSRRGCLRFVFREYLVHRTFAGSNEACRALARWRRTRLIGPLPGLAAVELTRLQTGSPVENSTREKSVTNIGRYTTMSTKTAEGDRLDDGRSHKEAWKKWGPYLSERQWGTVREDYSENGDAWNFFTHDQARPRAYRWGEDGIAGISDDKQRLCFALAFWHAHQPILNKHPFVL